MVREEESFSKSNSILVNSDTSGPKPFKKGFIGVKCKLLWKTKNVNKAQETFKCWDRTQ